MLRIIWKLMHNPTVSKTDVPLQNDWNIHIYLFHDSGTIAMQASNTRTNRFLPGTYYAKLDDGKNRIRDIVASIYFNCAKH